MTKTEFTDSDGAFRFDGLPEGTAKLDIDKKHGRVIGNYSKVPVGQSGLEIVIERFARLKGRVTDEAGKPVEQFNVNAWTYRAQGSYSISASCTNGVFDLRNAGAGQVRISAYSRDVGDGQTGPIAVEPGATIEGIEIVIQPQGTISGVVLDKTTREPVAGAGIYVGMHLRRTRWDLQDDWKQAVTGEDGSFTVDGLQPATMKVAALHPDYSAGMKEGISVTRGQVTRHVEILLSRGAEINGHVYVNGVGRSGISLDISGSQGEYIRTESGMEGYYRHTGLVPGLYHVSASLNEGSSNRRTSGRALLREGQSTTLDLAFTGSASIAGTVTRLGKPVAEVRVYANSQQSVDFGNSLMHRASGHTITGEDGTYRIDGLPLGIYTIGTYNLQGKATVPVKREVVLNQGVVVCHIELDEAGLGEVSGYIFMDGNPVKDARVYLMVHYQYKHTKSDHNGYYTFTEVPSGETEVTVTCYSDGNRTLFELKTKIEVAANESIREDFHFTTGSGTLYGSLTCNGKPASDTWVQIKSDAKESEHPFTINVFCRDGSFRAENMLPGRYNVSISNPWTLSETVEVKNNKESRVDFNYSQGDAVLAGSVDGPKDGKKSVITHIYLFKFGTCTWEVGKPVITPTYSQGLFAAIPIPWGGIFRQENLSPGTYDVVALLSKEGIAVKLDMKRITLQDGETTEVKLDVGE